MSREHKFRAIILERNAVIHFTLQDLIEDKFSNREIMWPWLRAGNKPDESIGLLDKNGREIYEGDVYRSWRYIVAGGKQLRPARMWVVGQTIALWHVVLCLSDDNNIEVIGSIQENPELLNADTTKK